MALTKVNYVDGVTTIMAKNLNDIQNEVIANGTAIGTQADQISGKASASALTAEATARADADTALGNELNDVKSSLGDISFEWVVGKYVHKDNGTEQPLGVYDSTSFIPCASVGISVKTEIFSGGTAGICFYDVDKNFISGFDASAYNYSLFNLTIPDNAAYVRVSCADRYKNSFILKAYNFMPVAQQNIGVLKNDVAKLKENQNSIFGAIEPSKNLLPIEQKTTTVAGTECVYEDGEFSVSGTASSYGGRGTPIMQSITLPAGAYTFWAIDGVCETFLQKTSDDSIVSSISGGNSWTAHFTLSEDTTVYIGYNVASGTSYNFTTKIIIEKGEEKTEYEKPSKIKFIDSTARKALPILDRFWAYAMGDVLCIGDSLTAGACYTGNWNGADIEQNYPKMLGRMLTANVTNGGSSGITAKNWYNLKINDYTLSNYDTFIIWLGTNEGLTDTISEDVDPYSDYHNYADTNTGCYCKIIEAIQEANPDCFIVLTKVFTTSGNLATTNSVIEQIANKYNLLVVDNSDLTIVNYPKLHGNINNIHFCKTGNLFIANRYITLLSEYFASNPLETNYGLTARIMT